MTYVIIISSKLFVSLWRKTDESDHSKKIKKDHTYYKWQTNSNENFSEEMTMFTLTGKGVTYAFAALESGYIAHVYYGKRADDEDLSYLLRLDEYPFVPKVNERDMGTFHHP